ncbi:MAG: Xaa-Pro peptidase family protein [Actinomycetota bacterium]
MSGSERLARTREALGASGLDALLVAPSPDLSYLAGYDPPPLERLTLLVVRPEADPVLVVPELERPLAQASPAGSLFEIRSWRDAEDPYAIVAGMLGGAHRAAITDRAWASHALRITRAAPYAELVPTSDAIPLLRAVKDDREIDDLARAGLGADQAFAEIVGEPFAGRTERDIATDLARLLREHGHTQINFTIVGSGPNAASPHHDPTDRTIRVSEPVVMDFGGRIDTGYCSDVTRTVVVGDVHAEVSEVHEVVRTAQQAAFEAIRPGVTAEEVDRAAREVIEAAGYGERFVHRTGHGIGLEEHEPPFIVAGNRDLLATGMVFSIEPGIYLEGRFGVRIEDIVVVTEDGARRLNDAPREPVVVR